MKKINGEWPKHRTMGKTISGVVLFEGISRLDGKTPIVVIATFESSNEKTGNMIQTWILNRDISPVESVKTGQDGSNCGDCPHRSGNGCYVNVGQAPLAVWRAFHNGVYPTYDRKAHHGMFVGRRARIGSYGDPATVSVEVFKDILLFCDGHTGYTHQWDNPLGLEYRGILQASCDNSSQTAKAISQGWKCFTVVPTLSDIQPNVGVQCVSDSHGKTCLECKLCNGSKTNVAIVVHGSKANKARLNLQTV